MVNPRYENFFKKDWDKAYKFWHQIIDRNDLQINILQKEIANLKRKEVRLLDLGCGSGDYMEAIVKKMPEISFSLVANDTSTQALDQYKERLADLVVQTYDCRLEEVPKKIHSSFDLVLFSHSLYGVDIKNLFSHYQPLLAPNGIILVFLESASSTIVQLRRRFWPAVYNETCDEITAEDVMAELTKNGFIYRTEPVRYRTDLHKLKQIDVDGLRKFYIPFFLRNPVQDKKIKNEIVHYVTEKAPDGFLLNYTIAIVAEKK